VPLKLCSFGGCKSVVEVPSHVKTPPRCERHSVSYSVPKQIYAHHYHNGKKIYSSTRWLSLRQQKITLQPLCEHCLRYEIVKPGYIVDHVKEIKDGGEIWDIENLEHLCHSCHNAKTARERLKRKRKSNQNGFGSLSDF